MGLILFIFYSIYERHNIEEICQDPLGFRVSVFCCIKYISGKVRVACHVSLVGM